MLGLMQSRPLLISGLVDYASTWHGGREIVSRDAEGAIHRSNYAEVAARAKRVANALDALGAGHGDRVATLAWNGIAPSGTLLWRDELGTRPAHGQSAPLSRPDPIHHAPRGRRVCVLRPGVYAAHRGARPASAACARLGRALRGEASFPRRSLTGLLAYEDLLAKASPEYEWPLFDENTASTLCYTSGTTGNPKGVLYSHRSTVLHALRRLRGRRIRPRGARFDPHRGAAVPRQRVEPAVFRGDVRGEARAPRSEARSRKPLYAARE